MPNTLGTTAASALIVQRALSIAVTKRPQLRAISLNFLDENGLAGRARLNQQVIAKLASVPAVGTFAASASDQVLTDVPVTLSAFKQVYVKFTAAELQASDLNLVSLIAEPLAIAFATHVIDAVAALWLPAKYPNETVEAAADVDYETLTALREALSGRGIQGPLFAAVNGPAYTKLLNDDRILRPANPTVDVIGLGAIQGVAGFRDIFEYPGCPTTSNLQGFAGSAESAVVAIRPPQDPREILPNAPAIYNLDYITEPTTGLTVAVQEWIDEDLSANVRLIWLEGYDKGNVAAGQRLVTAAT